MKKIFIAATVVCLSLVTLTGCSVTVRESSENPDVISTTGLRSSQGSGMFCDTCGKELSNRECGEKYQITFFSGRIVEETYNLVCPDCADNIVAYIEQLKNSDEK
jgi:hypothetical protein